MMKVIMAILIPPVFIGTVVGLFILATVLPSWALGLIALAGCWGWFSYGIWYLLKQCY